MNSHWYTINNFPFRKLVSELFCVDKLELLHEDLAHKYSAEDGVAGLGNDTHSHYHKTFIIN